jgi:hypothetical protein
MVAVPEPHFGAVTAVLQLRLCGIVHHGHEKGPDALEEAERMPPLTARTP